MTERQVDLLAQWSDELDGVAVGEGAFAPGPALWVGTREVAHFHAGHTLEVRLTRAVIRQRRDELRADDRITLRAVAAANLPTAAPGLPPTGADLARRRRFH